jgi:hypothetical protein
MRRTLGVILLSVVGSAQAVPVTWTFEDVVFDGGGTLSGSFVFDVDSEEVAQVYQHVVSDLYYQAFYSDIAIQTSEPDPEGTDSVFTVTRSYVGIPNVWEPEIDGNLWQLQNGAYLGSEYETVWDEELQEYIQVFSPPPEPTGDPTPYQNDLRLWFEDICSFYCVSQDLNLTFAQPLTNAGGVIDLSGYETATIRDTSYNFLAEGTRTIVSGRIVGSSVVPIPAAVWLFGSALAGLGWFRRKA